jgi:hypothetical protein
LHYYNHNDHWISLDITNFWYSTNETETQWYFQTLEQPKPDRSAPLWVELREAFVSASKSCRRLFA